MKETKEETSSTKTKEKERNESVVSVSPRHTDKSFSFIQKIRGKH